MWKRIDKTKADSVVGPAFAISDDLVSVELEDFHVLEGFSVDDHADESDLLMEA